MPSPRHAADLALVASLGDPIRLALYRLLARSSELVGRDEAAAELQIPRPTAAFHLDKLAELGLVTVQYSRRSGATGPGAGRPAKLYRAVASEVGASVPERHYDLAAELMIGSLEALGAESPPVHDAIVATATARGRRLASVGATVIDVLENAGFEPRMADDVIALDNCPFRQLAAAHQTTVCTANHALVRGALEELGENPDRAEFVPGGAGCCVQVVPV